MHYIVLLPDGFRFSQGESRTTISEIRKLSLSDLKFAIADPANWQSLFSHFDYEKALSGYIATYPHHLEDGLTPHPNDKVREKVFNNRSRSDVLLLDRKENPVVVECKQERPTTDAINQLRGYLDRVKEETGRDARGILVHGGSRKLHRDVERAAARKPRIEVVQHRLHVEFSKCN